MMILDSYLAELRRRFERAGLDSPALDARILVRQGGQISDAELITLGQTPLSAEQIEDIEKLAVRRERGEPVSRIIGTREFWGLTFTVGPDTLDPRADTETLVAAALARARSLKKPRLRLLDLGTGTGCIMLSLLHELPDATGVAIDLSAGALEIAALNASRLGLSDRVEFRIGSWFEPIAEDEQFDMIVSNPPYIPRQEIESLAKEVRDHDPILALEGGVDGLRDYQIILKNMKKHLGCGGYAFFEIGRNHEKDVERLSRDSMMTQTESYRDLAGTIRVLELVCGEK